MKTLMPEQYAFLVAIKQGNSSLAAQLVYTIPRKGELWDRGLYIAEEDPNDPGYRMYATAKLTTAGLTAIQCYEVIHGINSFSWGS